MKIFLVVLLVLAVSGCSDSAKAKKALIDSGFTDIQITGWKLFGCDDKDNFTTGFKAINTVGKPVEGVVCSGWFKGATVRFK